MKSLRQLATKVILPIAIIGTLLSSASATTFRKDEKTGELVSPEKHLEISASYRFGRTKISKREPLREINNQTGFEFDVSLHKKYIEGTSVRLGAALTSSYSKLTWDEMPEQVRQKCEEQGFSPTNTMHANEYHGGIALKYFPTRHLNRPYLRGLSIGAEAYVNTGRRDQPFSEENGLDFLRFQQFRGNASLGYSLDLGKEKRPGRKPINLETSVGIGNEQTRFQLGKGFFKGESTVGDVSRIYQNTNWDISGSINGSYLFNSRDFPVYLIGEAGYSRDIGRSEANGQNYWFLLGLRIEH